MFCPESYRYLEFGTFFPRCICAAASPVHAILRGCASPGTNTGIGTHHWLHHPHAPCGWTLANCLLEIVAQGLFGIDLGDFHTRTNRSLRRAWLSFKTWAKNAKHKHSQRTFTCAQLSVGGGANHWPEFKGKAHNSAVVVRWLNQIVGELALRDERQQIRATLLSSHIAVYDIMEAGSTF